jgi:hypothetical protein
MLHELIHLWCDHGYGYEDAQHRAWCQQPADLGQRDEVRVVLLARLHAINWCRWIQPAAIIRRNHSSGGTERVPSFCRRPSLVFWIARHRNLPFVAEPDLFDSLRLASMRIRNP